MNKFQTLHETPIRAALDLLSLIKNTDIEDIANAAKRSPYASTSIARITNDMTLVFPVMCSNSLHIDTAIMISKSIERKCVSMLQILFSAFQVSDATDAKELISRFHSNIKLSGKATVDDFIALGDALSESGRVKVDQSRIKLLSKDFRENCFFVLEHQNISPTSIATQYSGHTPLLEAKPGRNAAYTKRRNSDPDTGAFIDATDKNGNVIDRRYIDDPQAPVDPELPYVVTDPDGNKLNTAGMVSAAKDTLNLAGIAANNRLTDLKADQLFNDMNRTYADAMARIANGTATEGEIRFMNQYADYLAKAMKGKIDEAQWRKLKAERRKTEEEIKRLRDPKEREKRELEIQKMQADIDKIHMGMAKDLSDIARNEVDFFNKQILSGDIKKATELQPTTMVMSFKHLDSASGRTTEIENVVIGVKARLIPVDSSDIINHIVTKLEDKQFIFNLVRATTREISFVKDFMFALDKAKIEALANSRRGSADRMWKVLERRAMASKFKRTIGVAGNNANAITSLVVSQEEVDYVHNNYGRDLNGARTCNAIMDAYNFMAIVIADESLEVCKFLFDTGEDSWEVLPFTALEREAQDNSYKKIVNLMSKIS